MSCPTFIVDVCEPMCAVNCLAIELKLGGDDGLACCALRYYWMLGCNVRNILLVLSVELAL
jgi:hypothetical protein